MFGSNNIFGQSQAQQQQQQQQQPQQHQQQQAQQQPSIFQTQQQTQQTQQQPSFSWSKPSDQSTLGFSMNNGNINNNTSMNLNGNNNSTLNQSLNITALNNNNNQNQLTIASASNPFQQTQAYGTGNGPSVLDQIEKIKDSWDPTSPQCALQYFFYNKVGQQQALLYQKPPGIEQSKWDDAMAARPDDSHVPAHVVGFFDLQKRVSRQEATVVVYRQRMHEINEKLNQLSSRHDLHTTVRIAQMRARHNKLVHRTLSLASKIQVLRNRGYVLRPDEEVLKKELELLNKQVDDPAVFGRINEIWARLTVLRERAQSLSQQVNEYESMGMGLDWNRDDEQLEKLAKVLKSQQVGISYLADVLQKDTAQVEDIINGFTEQQQRQQDQQQEQQRLQSKQKLERGGW